MEEDVSRQDVEEGTKKDTDLEWEEYQPPGTDVSTI